MGDVTRFRNYPQMATVKKAAETFGVFPLINAASRYTAVHVRPS